MEHLLSRSETIKSRITGKNVFLFLDYDGTLTPITETPEEAIMSREALDELFFIAKCPHCLTAVISGRSLENIRAIVPVSGLIYAGNHGLEVYGAAIGTHVFAPKTARENIQKIKIKLQKTLGSIQGFLLEDKEWTLSCHFRKVSKKDTVLLKSIFNEVVRSFQKNAEIRVVEGKEVLEVRPSVDWNKGKTVEWLLNKRLFASNQQIVPVYVGDDITDIDAFKILQNRGITVWVGKEPKFQTGYSLKDSAEVIELLKKLRSILLEGKYE